MSLHSVPPRAQRHPESIWESQGAEAATSRGAAALLERYVAGQPFRAVLRDLGLTSNQVWGLTKTDDDWSAALEATLTATRRGDLQHGTSAAYAHGCVCSECREYQRRRMTKNRK